MAEQPCDVLCAPLRRVGRPTQRNESSPDEQGDDQEATDGELYNWNKDGEPNSLSEPGIRRVAVPCRSALALESYPR